MGDMKILGKTREPLIISCEQCNKELGIVVGDVEHRDAGTHLCLPCVKRLAAWLEHVYG